MFRAVFITLLTSYLFFATLEEFFDGFVSRYFNLNWLLLGVFLSALPVFGAASVQPAETPRSRAATWFLLVASSLVTLALVFFSAGALEIRWRMLLSAYGGLMTAAILSVLFEE